MSSHECTDEDRGAAPPNEAAPTADELLAEFITETLNLREAEQLVKELKIRVKDLEAPLVEHWTDRGQTQAKIGGRTVYVREEFICRKNGNVSTEAICKTLHKLGYGEIIAPDYSTGKLKAIVKSLIDETEIGEKSRVPEELASRMYINLSPRLTLRG